ncbi:MAG: response regulator, partial [Myxococcota bacterium]
MQAKILIVDDEPAIRHVLQRQLRRLGHLTLETDTGQTALQMMADQEIDVALVDLNLHAPDGMDGLALITQAAARSPRTRCVMVTGSGQPDDAWQALSVGAFDYLYKPDIDGDVLDDLIERAMAWKLATQDPQFVSMIGRSEAMQNLQKRIRRIAPLPINALIVGESGSGKERVARALHALAPQGPFVAINCAALPQGVLVSELFGHRPLDQV